MGLKASYDVYTLSINCIWQLEAAQMGLYLIGMQHFTCHCSRSLVLATLVALYFFCPCAFNQLSWSTVKPAFYLVCAYGLWKTVMFDIFLLNFFILIHP